MNEIEKFIAEVRAAPQWASIADQLEEVFQTLHREGDDNADAVELFDAIRWIVRQPRSIEERMRAMKMLFDLSGKVVNLNLREFLGWVS
jgi:hypothetical protein